MDEVFNVASGVETSLGELCLALLETMGSGLRPKYVHLPAERKKVEVMRRLAGISKARELIGFEAKVSLKEGLTRLCEWLHRQSFDRAWKSNVTGFSQQTEGIKKHEYHINQPG